MATEQGSGKGSGSGSGLGSSDFQFPAHYSFPPFFTRQPNPITRSSQFQSWSALIQAYCRHHRLFSLAPLDALETPLFSNAALGRKLSLQDAREILEWMASREGGERVEWVSVPGKKGRSERCWVYWRRPEEWVGVIEAWVDGTGQRGSVLTFYELVESDATMNQDFHGMDTELLHKSLQILVKRGKAQIFGQEDSLGVKFF